MIAALQRAFWLQADVEADNLRFIGPPAACNLDGLLVQTVRVDFGDMDERLFD